MNKPLLSFAKSDYTIVSGGQTGADIAGLNAARTLKFKTGGWAPKDWMTESGPQKELLESFGLIEHKGGYRPRTIQNVKDSDITFIISRKWSSPGTILTMNACKKNNKPFIAMTEELNIYELYMLPDLKSKIKKSLKLSDLSDEDINTIERQHNLIAECLLNYRTINVAGNSESNASGIELMSFNIFYDIFNRMF